MKTILYLLLILTVSLPQAVAQEFGRPNATSIQPKLSQPLEWASASATIATSLPAAFLARPQDWVFQPYTTSTVLPTGSGRDVWLKFSLSATPSPQNWVLSVPRITVQKVSLYSLNAMGRWEFQSAGNLLAPKNWPRATRTPSFDLMTSDADTSYFLRFEHHSPLAERAELMSGVDFVESASRASTLIGTALGMSSVMMIACLIAFAVSRNSIFFWLTTFMASVLMMNLTQLGYGGWRLWPSSSYVNTTMAWIAPLLSMAAASWFFARATYAKYSHKMIYGLLVGATGANLLLCIIKLAFEGAIPSVVLNVWAALVVLTVVASLVWLSLRGTHWNLRLLAGALPIAAAGVLRISYSYGWLAHGDSLQATSVFLNQAGLMWLLVVLVWRSRNALVAKELSSALANDDPATGLVMPRVAKIRMTQMLLRSDRLKLGCGVIMLRWVHFADLMSSQPPLRKEDMRKQLGRLLAGLVRDIDTAAVLGDGNFLLLVEGPVNRSSLASLSTQILSGSLRLSERFELPHAFELNIAIWHADMTASTTPAVIDALRTKLSQMPAGTKRPVQFVDSLDSAADPEREQEFGSRRDELLAKINALEASPSFQVSRTAAALRRTTD